MRYRRPLLTGGLALLAGALTGCGSVAASAPAAAPAGTAAPPAAASQVGCASVSQATTVAVTIRRAMHLAVPVDNGSQATTSRQPALVQALFRDFCAAVGHPVRPVVMHCPADFGTEYAGTFYQGSRVLATFTYSSTGCQRVTVTAAGQTRSTMVIGRAAAAAPHLESDLEAIVGVSNVGGLHPLGTVNPGGPDKPPA